MTYPCPSGSYDVGLKSSGFLPALSFVPVSIEKNGQFRPRFGPVSGRIYPLHFSTSLHKRSRNYGAKIRNRLEINEEMLIFFNKKLLLLMQMGQEIRFLLHIYPSYFAFSFLIF